MYDNCNSNNSKNVLKKRYERNSNSIKQSCYINDSNNCCNNYNSFLSRLDLIALRRRDVANNTNSKTYIISFDEDNSSYVSVVYSDTSEVVNTSFSKDGIYPKFPVALDTYNEYIYVANSYYDEVNESSYITKFDTNNFQIKNISLNDSNVSPSYPMDIKIVGKYAYVVNGGYEENTSSSYLSKVDCDTDEVKNINLRTNKIDYSEPYFILSHKNYIYVCDFSYDYETGSAYISKIDIYSDKVLNISLNSSETSPSNPISMTSIGDYIYVANHFYDIKNKSSYISKIDTNTNKVTNISLNSKEVSPCYPCKIISVGNDIYVANNYYDTSSNSSYVSKINLLTNETINISLNTDDVSPHCPINLMEYRGYIYVANYSSSDDSSYISKINSNTLEVKNISLNKDVNPRNPMHMSVNNNYIYVSNLNADEKTGRYYTSRINVLTDEVSNIPLEDNLASLKSITM